MTQRPRQSRFSSRWVAALMVGAASVACQATLDAPSVGQEKAPEGAGPLPLRMLTRAEYAFTVQDQLGYAGPLGQKFPSEITGTSGFATVGALSAVNVREYMLSAEVVAKDVAQRLGSFASCADKAAAGDACAKEILSIVGRRLLRHPLTSEDEKEFFAIYQAARKDWGATFVDANRTVVQALLQSPLFLYRWELDGLPPTWDEGNGLVRLSPYQLASRLSFFLWSSSPDEELLQAAAKGKLATDEGVREQAERLLADPRAARSIASFHLQWLHVEQLQRLVKNEARYPEFNDELKAAMLAQFERFTTDVVTSGGTLTDLLTRVHKPTGPALSALYGETSSADLQLQRSGVLTTAAFLASHSDLNEGNPILRGRVVREQLLCETLRAPPPGIPTLAELDPSLPMRQRLGAHVTERACKGCHLLTDPIGFGLGNYDAIGRFKTEDQGVPIDASGLVSGLDGADPSFEGASELGAILGGSRSVNECASRQWLRYALGRGEAATEEAELTQAAADVEAGGGAIRSLIIRLTTSRPFTHRSPVTGEKPE